MLTILRYFRISPRSLPKWIAVIILVAILVSTIVFLCKRLRKAKRELKETRPILLMAQRTNQFLTELKSPILFFLKQVELFRGNVAYLQELILRYKTSTTLPLEEQKQLEQSLGKSLEESLKEVDLLVDRMEDGVRDQQKLLASLEAQRFKPLTNTDET